MQTYKYQQLEKKLQNSSSSREIKLQHIQTNLHPHCLKKNPEDW
jgi:hypothetical protein